jgi:transglutaminase-like putative cysteine protease
MAGHGEALSAAPGSRIRLRYGVELDYEVRAGGADFIFNVQAARTARQAVVAESLALSQCVATREWTDPVSGGRLLRLQAFPGPLRLQYEATVDLDFHRAEPSAIAETRIADLPAEVLPFLYPSRYCESDKLNALAMAQFGGLWQGYGRVQAIRDWVLNRVQFASGSSCGTTGAAETVDQRRGVCRDFAHLMIALCRAVNIPARFATGLDYGADPALGPPDFHAYVEAYVGQRWYLFDPSGTAIPMGLLRLTSGRDAADSAFATIFGDVVPVGQRLGIDAVPGADGVLRVPHHTHLALSSD